MDESAFLALVEPVLAHVLADVAESDGCWQQSGRGRLHLAVVLLLLSVGKKHLKFKMATLNLFLTLRWPP